MSLLCVLMFFMCETKSYQAICAPQTHSHTHSTATPYPGVPCFHFLSWRSYATCPEDSLPHIQCYILGKTPHPLIFPLLWPCAGVCGCGGWLWMERWGGGCFGRESLIAIETRQAGGRQMWKSSSHVTEKRRFCEAVEIFHHPHTVFFIYQSADMCKHFQLSFLF